ncbi:hypothetical protein [Bradyrhizobium sp. CB3481]|uniref:hypothetical protein n=1 Tax=Bradyrhizobium sp. CB3481 TaxID=3039158 RepID=UPI0032C2499F
MTLHRHWPEVEKMLVTVDSFAMPRALWHTDAEFSRRMLREWDKIEPYKARVARRRPRRWAASAAVSASVSQPP